MQLPKSLETWAALWWLLIYAAAQIIKSWAALWGFSYKQLRKPFKSWAELWWLLIYAAAQTKIIKYMRGFEFLIPWIAPQDFLEAAGSAGGGWLDWLLMACYNEQSRSDLEEKRERQWGFDCNLPISFWESSKRAPFRFWQIRHREGHVPPQD
jgi:hypothetical protein